MIYQPKLDGSFSVNGTPRHNLINYTNPWDYNSAVYKGADIPIPPNGYLNLTSIHDPEDPHAERIFLRFQKDVKDVLTGKNINFNLELEQLCEFVVRHLQKMQSSECIQIFIDIETFPYPIDFHVLKTLLESRILKAGLMLINGYAWDITMFDNQIQIKRKSVNGFNPENIYHAESGSLFTYDTLNHFRENIEYIYNVVSSMKVGDFIAISVPEFTNYESRVDNIKLMETLLHQNGYKLSRGFNYKYEWRNPYYYISRLTLDGKREPAIEA